MMDDLPPKDFGREPPDTLAFGDQLSALCAFELSAAHGDPERIGAMIERLVNAVSFTVAIAGGAEPERVGFLLEGARSYLDNAAADHLKIGAFMSKGRRA